MNDDFLFLRKLTKFQVRCARAKAAQPLQIALAVYCAVISTTPTIVSCFHKEITACTLQETEKDAYKFSMVPNCIRVAYDIII
jgi:hypothetical protein